MIRLDLVHLFALHYDVAVQYDVALPTVALARGVFHPHILVGTPFGALSPDEQWAVLLHELGHLEHNHRLLRWLTLPLFWSAWAARLRHRHECEADRYAVREGYGAPLAAYLCRHNAPDVLDRVRRIRQLLQEQIHVAQAA